MTVIDKWQGDLPILRKAAVLVIPGVDDPAQIYIQKNLLRLTRAETPFLTQLLSKEALLWSRRGGCFPVNVIQDCFRFA